MRSAILIAGVLLAMPVHAAERLTDAQLDRITAGGFVTVDTAGRLVVSGPANIGIFVNDSGQGGRPVGTLGARGFDTPARLDVSGPANIGIFVNDSGQAGRLVRTLRARGFVVDTPGRLDVSGPANIGIFVNDGGQAGRLVGTLGAPGFSLVDTPGRFVTGIGQPGG